MQPVKQSGLYSGNVVNTISEKENTFQVLSEIPKNLKGKFISKPPCAHWQQSVKLPRWGAGGASPVSILPPPSCVALGKGPGFSKPQPAASAPEVYCETLVIRQFP